MPLCHGLIPREVPSIEKKRGEKKGDQDKKPSIIVIPGPKPGKPIDLSRMRQILLKLKHTPPLPPPAKDAKVGKDGKETSAKATPIAEGASGSQLKDVTSNDPIYAEIEKLEIMIKLASDQNIDQVLLGFKKYATEEPTLVQLQLLTATVKLFLKKPTESPQQVIQVVLNNATIETDNPNLRDRAYIY
ncbi:unnamed protein product [Vicia faba]|uniref:Uncharacterized protein n=1 Tax=Vicia faba TaxID=3906 RepID=A0AAV0Z7N5_VICFA|nr:unnamed protein product [Vicia faba]